MSDITTLEEKYSSAIHSSNLRVEADKGGAADVLIAVGWSASRMGAALMRLHTEYEGAGLSRNPSRTDMSLLLSKLKSMADVRREAEIQANTWRMDDAAHVAFSVVLYWLDQRCRACEGRGAKVIPGTPALQSKPCRVCCGSGKAVTPHGDAGKRLANHLDYCVNAAQQSIKKRLHGMRNM
jgi:hypothetical protein